MRLLVSVSQWCAGNDRAVSREGALQFISSEATPEGKPEHLGMTAALIRRCLAVAVAH